MKRDSPNGSPPQDADDLFKLLKRTADKMGGGGNGETKRKSRRPGPPHMPFGAVKLAIFVPGNK